MIDHVELLEMDALRAELQAKDDARRLEDRREFIAAMLASSDPLDRLAGILASADAVKLEPHK